MIKRTQHGWDKPEFYTQDALRLAREAGTASPALVKTDRFEVGGIEINNFCNLNCRMCNSNQAKRPRGFMTPEVFECLVKQLKAAGIQRTALHTIGEPLLHGHLLRLLEIAERYKLKVWISTNAQFPELIEAILKNHRQVLSSIRISVDGATASTYEYIRSGGYFSKVLESLEIIGLLNGGRPDCEFNLNLHTVISMANIHEIPLFFQAFGKYVWPEKMIFSLINGLSPDPGFFREVFPFPNLITPTIPCLHPFRHMSILNDGRATLCCADFVGELTIGNALDTPLSTLWHSPDAEAIRRQHLDPETMQLRSCMGCHEPYSFSSHILDAYIHFLWLSAPELPADEFGKQAIDLLKTMDQAVAQNELHLLPERIRPFFGIE
ncbi:MAG: radical SAM protein [Acidobacteria bacterium]|nr:radical SAM protein [Acidobacteriota bacterium]